MKRKKILNLDDHLESNMALEMWISCLGKVANINL